MLTFFQRSLALSRTIFIAAASRTVQSFTLILGLILADSTLHRQARGEGPPTDQVPSVLAWERFAETGLIEQSRLGRVLLAELSCTACHEPPAGAGLAARQGPRLQGIGLRRSQQWLDEFLTDPQRAKPGTTMPDLLDGPLAAEKRRAIVAFLRSSRIALHEPIPDSKDGDPNASSPQRGRRLFQRIGCVACHGPPSAERTEASGRFDDAFLRLTRLSDRYDQVSLAQFLLDPLRERPHGGMPNFHLDPLEASDLAHYLLGRKLTREPSKPAPDPELVEEGKQWFRSIGCAQCHTEVLPNAVTRMLAPPLADLGDEQATGCLSQTSRKGLPRFGASSEQTIAMQSALTELGRPSPIEPSEKLEQTLVRLNCMACHSRGIVDDQHLGGVQESVFDFFQNQRDVDLGDEGRLPPSLDGVGAKLTSTWLHGVLRGDHRVRPYLWTRMPIYSEAWTQSLTEGFKQVDLPLVDSPAAQVTPRTQAEGRRLLDVGCVQCHPIAGEFMTGVVGIDLSHLEQRLEPAWFRKFLENPGRLKSGTRMPQFFLGKKSTVPDILEGDVEAQIDAIWTYLRDEPQPIPERILADQAKSFEIQPEDRPVVLRTFFEGVGNHALVIGFPERVHVAIDRRTGEVRCAWSGRFMDAHGTWFDRFAPPARPLGAPVIEMSGHGKWEQVDRDANEPPETFPITAIELDDEGRPTLIQSTTTGEIRQHWRGWTSGTARGVELKAEWPGKQRRTWSIGEAAGSVVQREGRMWLGEQLSLQLLKGNWQKVDGHWTAQSVGDDDELEGPRQVIELRYEIHSQD